MEIIAAVVIVFILFQWFVRTKQIQKETELITSVTDLHRGTSLERRLVLDLREYGIKPGAIFHDLYLNLRNDIYSQIDLVLATRVGLIVFEVKDYSGWIFGNGNSRYWTQVLSYGRHKYRFYNPIFQNKRHIDVLRKQSHQFSRIPIFSVVLFSDDCELKRMTSIPDNVFIIQSYELKETLDYILSGFPSATYTNKIEISDVLRQASINGGNIDIQRIHKEYVSNVKFAMGSKDGRIQNYWDFRSFSLRDSNVLRWLRSWR